MLQQGKRRAFYKPVASESSRGDRCITRVPYATLIATLMCCAGVAIFVVTAYRGVSFTLSMFKNVFNVYFSWLSDLHVVFIALGVCMGLMCIAIVVVGFLATGSTRSWVYGGWRSRLGGRVSCGILTGLTYLLTLLWLALLALLAVVVVAFFLLAALCNNLKESPLPKEQQCLDFSQFDYLFPNDTITRICQDSKKKIFCRDCVENAILMYLLAFGASALVVVSLIHFLMCLAANSARIRDHEKLQELEELQYLESTDMACFAQDRYKDTSSDVFRKGLR